MEIVKTTEADIPTLLELYAQAKIFMATHGNPNQWNGSYPEEELLHNDVAEGNSYVCKDKGKIVGTFYFVIGEDPTYGKIYDGAWRNDRPYGVIHRICVGEHEKGVATFCVNWAFKQCRNVRIDTHKDNTVMQSFLQKNGFSYCGIIHLLNGAPRLAYQKSDF